MATFLQFIPNNFKKLESARISSKATKIYGKYLINMLLVTVIAIGDSVSGLASFTSALHLRKKR